MNNFISVVQADITGLAVDAIVNAANTSLLGGGDVDGVIHRRAGSQLLAECRLLGGCQTGEAKMTAGYRLPAKHVIHTVGPVWRDGKHREPELLAACYRNSLRLAVAENIRCIAFPCISTGIFGFPNRLAAQIAVATVAECLRREGLAISVIFCCFSQADADIYRELVSSLSSGQD